MYGGDCVLRLVKFDPREVVHECLRNSVGDVDVKFQILLNGLSRAKVQLIDEPNADALYAGRSVDVREYPPDFLGFLRKFVPSTVRTQTAEYEPVCASLDGISAALCPEAPSQLFLLHIYG